MSRLSTIKASYCEAHMLGLSCCKNSAFTTVVCWKDHLPIVHATCGPGLNTRNYFCPWRKTATRAYVCKCLYSKYEQNVLGHSMVSVDEDIWGGEEDRYSTEWWHLSWSVIESRVLLSGLWPGQPQILRATSWRGKAKGLYNITQCYQWHKELYELSQ